jgi:hypothetical protein
MMSIGGRSPPIGKEYGLGVGGCHSLGGVAGGGGMGSWDGEGLEGGVSRGSVCQWSRPQSPSEFFSWA